MVLDSSQRTSLRKTTYALLIIGAIIGTAGFFFGDDAWRAIQTLTIQQDIATSSLQLRFFNDVNQDGEQDPLS